MTNYIEAQLMALRVDGDEEELQSEPLFYAATIDNNVDVIIDPFAPDLIEVPVLVNQNVCFTCH